jgi:glutaconate CoA-transferase subunit A
MPVPGHVGTDYEKLRPEFKVIADPYSGKEVFLVPPLVPDVALLHALAADRAGNLLLEEKEDDFLLAQASRVVVASAERIVETAELRRADYGVFLQAIYVTAVVPLPGGAHPTSLRDAYGLDERHLREYLARAASDESFRAYLDRYVFEPKDHEEYLERVGLSLPSR